jgi:hypothetical protein
VNNGIFDIKKSNQPINPINIYGDNGSYSPISTILPPTQFGNNAKYTTFLIDTRLANSLIFPFTISTLSGTAFVDWGDGTYNTYTTTGAVTHTYSGHGAFIVSISDNVTAMSMSVSANNLFIVKCLTIANPVTSIAFGSTVGGCVNLIELPLKVPNNYVIGSYHFLNMGLNINTRGFLDVNEWGIRNLTTNIFNCFQGATYFNSPLDKWDMSAITNTNGMFTSAISFNQDIGNWDIGNVVITQGMFATATSFNQDLGLWNMSKVTNLASMFQGATSFNNGGSSSLSGWNMPAVTGLVGLFQSATSFNQDIGSWNIGKVTSFANTFNGATSFNNGGSPSISGWNTGSGTTMQQMFINATNFNQPINTWNVTGVNNMVSVLQGASSFNQTLSGWNICNVTGVITVTNTALSTANYDSTLIDWNNRKSVAVNGVRDWNTNVQPNFGSTKYSIAASGARQALQTYGWVFTDGGMV